MPITRTPIIDDDGTGETGTAIDNAWKQELYDQIDALMTAQLSTAQIWTAKQTFRVAPQVPASAGTGVFGLDCTDTAHLTAANNAIVTPFGNTNNFSGLVVITETLITGNTGLYLIGGAVFLVAQSSGAGFGTVQGTASKSNVYHVGGVVNIENKLGANAAYRVLALRTRIVL